MDTIWDLHEPAAASSWSECLSPALDSNDNEPSLIDRNQTFSAKTSSSACRGTVPVAYLTHRCRRQAQPQASTEVRASSEGESSLL
jgi:predicted deacylase